MSYITDKFKLVQRDPVYNCMFFSLFFSLCGRNGR